MKIQKLIYYAHGYYLAEQHGTPLIDEEFEAWPFGPVLPTIYHEFKGFRYDAISRFAEEYDSDLHVRIPVEEPSDRYTDRLIDYVWDTYGSKNATYLSRLTHKKGGPWDAVYNKASVHIKNQHIPNDLIQGHFDDLVGN